MEPTAPPEREPVAVASVVRGLGDRGAVRITVSGHWRTSPHDEPPTLLVADGRGRREIAALPGEPSPDDALAFRAVFDLPPALGGIAGEDLVLCVAGAEIALPAALPSVPPAPVRDVTAEAPPVPAEVVDRAVLAEHSARRAEQALDGLADRLRTLEAHLADVTGDRDRLRDALHRAQTDEEVAGLREDAAAAQGLEEALAAAIAERDESARLLAAAQAEIAGLREQLAAAREELEVVREERDGLRDAVARAERPAEPAAGLAELGETARLLRERAEDQLAARAPAGAPAEEDPFDVALAELRARTQPPAPEQGGNVIPFDPLRNTMNLAAMSPGRRARSRLRRVPPSDRRPVHGDSLEPERRSGVAWLAEALERFAADDLRGAGAFLLSILPDVARTFGEDLVFDVEVDGLAPHRVVLAGGRGTVQPLTDAAQGQAAFGVAGPVAALAPLAAGGAGRRLPGARVRGSRRTLRRVLKARRQPVDLGDLAAAGVVPEPRLLLSVLAAGVRPTWTGEEDFAVAIDVPGQEAITVVAQPGRRLQVVGAPPDGGAVRAVLQTSPAALLALLGRVAPPEGDDAWLSGEEEVMTTLLELLDRAQGLPSRH